MASFLQNPETVRELGTRGRGIAAGSFVESGTSKEPVIFQTSEQGLPAVAVAVPAVCLARACVIRACGGRAALHGMADGVCNVGARRARSLEAPSSYSGHGHPMSGRLHFSSGESSSLPPRRSVISCGSRKPRSTLATSARKQDGLWSSKRIAQDFSAEVAVKPRMLAADVPPSTYGIETGGWLIL